MTTPGLESARAQRLVERGLALGWKDFNRPICVAVCDAQGYLLAFGRGDGAPLRSIAISQSKAYTAVRMGMPTDAFLARLHRDNLEIGYFCDERFTALPGGVVFKDAQGVVLGGVGISGLTTAEDRQIAEALQAGTD